MNELLIRGASHLWTGRPGDARRQRGGTDIRVRKGLITAIGALAPEPGERIVDAAGCVIYPGWVHTYQHLFQSLLKGVPAGIKLALVPYQPRHFGLHDPAIGRVVGGGRPTLRALMVQGRVVVENDTIPGLDLAQLRRDAQARVNGMLA